jgi:hypothetical protein
VKTRQAGEAGSVKEGGDVQMIRRRRDDVERERRRDEERNYRRLAPSDDKSRPDKQQRCEVDEVSLDELRDAEGRDVSRLHGGVEAE